MVLKESETKNSNKITISSQKYLIICLAVVTFLYSLRWLMTEEDFGPISAISYITIPAVWVCISVLAVVKNNRLQRNQKNALIMFAFAAAFLFIAEQLWTLYDHVLEGEPFPSWADFFYLGSYPFLTAFLVLFLLPYREFITRKVVYFSTSLGIAFLLPSLFLTYDLSMEDTNFEIFVALLYPIVDSILIVPAVIGTSLFFKGKKNYFWSLVVLGIITFIVADEIFLYTVITDTYTDGHPVDILWLSTYVLFIFALYQIIVTRKNSMSLEQDSKDIPENVGYSTIMRVLIPLTIITITTVVLMAVFSIDFTDEPEEQLAYVYYLVYGIFAIIGIFTFIILLINRDLGRLVRMKTSELEENHKKLIKSERMSAIGQLSSQLAHDLRNPLAILKNSNDFLKDIIKESDDNASKNLQMIDRAINRMVHQIEGVLEFVKAKPLVLRRESLLEILEASNQMITIPQNIIISYPKKDILCDCDFQKIEVVITNLILNSVQAIGKEEGQVKVSFRKLENSVEIQVEDSGPGIPEDLLPKIFEPLFTTKMIGTGLGLASCKKIIEQHNGFINVKNNPTIFSIILPKVKTVYSVPKIIEV